MQKKRLTLSLDGNEWWQLVESLYKADADYPELGGV